MNDPYSFENGFYLTCAPNRIGKLIVHYELYSEIVGLAGGFLELGVFKGASFLRFLKFRDLLEPHGNRSFVGFDIFGTFPETTHPGDILKREAFIRSAGAESISEKELHQLITAQNLSKAVTTVSGDICQTLPKYLTEHPEARFSLINLDVDIYEPSKIALEHCWPKLLSGGILILDDYGFFPGATEAVDSYFADKKVTIEKSPLSAAPCWIRKP